MEYQHFCEQTYNQIFIMEFTRILGGKRSNAASNSAEREAQRIAIKNTLIQAMIAYPGIEASDVWNAIYVAHLKRKSGVTDLNTIDQELITRVISADQSWKKASGHAFESFIFEVSNPQLVASNIQFVLQSRLNEMIHEGNIHNDPHDINWLNSRIHTDVFDLYAIVSHLNRNFVFGCIQSKTSIRDRVTRDREPSQQAMSSLFWSIAVTLNGAFLAMPKFQEMVNGGGVDYEQNGWHGMYVMSDQFTNDRIYPVDLNLNLLITHAQQAAISWLSARNRFNSDWRP